MPQEVLQSSRPCSSMAAEVPPTAVTQGSLAGNVVCAEVELSEFPQLVDGSLSPQSPAEKFIEIPSTAASWNRCSYSATVEADSVPEVLCSTPPQESEITSAR